MNTTKDKMAPFAAVSILLLLLFLSFELGQIVQIKKRKSDYANGFRDGINAAKQTQTHSTEPAKAAEFRKQMKSMEWIVAWFPNITDPVFPLTNQKTP